MKKRTKLGLFGGTLLLGMVALSSCTNSFCSTKDKAHMMYAFDYGVTGFYNEQNDEGTREQLVVDGITYDHVYVDYSYNNCPAVKKIIDAAEKSNIAVPTLGYWKIFDEYALSESFNAARATYDFTNMTLVGDEETYEGTEDNVVDIKEDLLKDYGYVKFYYKTDVSYTHTKVRWENWDEILELVTADERLAVSDLPSTDFVNYYKKQMNNLITNYRSCIAVKDGYYGYYGSTEATKDTINIEKKTYGFAWSRGFFEGLIVWPIAALTDVIVESFLKVGLQIGGASVLAILVVTVIIRSVMLLTTWKQSTMNARMNELQPELQKIQNKYPNSNTSQQEKMRMAEETQKLYKKYNINPMKTLLITFIQFPVFICVWGALSGSAYLSTGTFLKLNLSSSISSVLLSADGWKSGAAVTALILFLLMAAAQTVAMLLPQWIQKSKAKNVAKLGKNPARSQQNNNMKIFTWVMLIMIIFMGFSLASGMGIYWLVGALFSIAQTLITQNLASKNTKVKTSKYKEKKK